jgi:hypothetical protein
MCGACRGLPYISHRKDGKWSTVLPDDPVIDKPIDPNYGGSLSDIYFDSADVGLAVGNWSTTIDKKDWRPLIYGYRGGLWYQDVSPVKFGNLFSVSMFDEANALAVGESGLILSYNFQNPLLTPEPQPTPTIAVPKLPTDRVPNPHNTLMAYFPSVGHTLQGRFREYWQQHGGLQQFGYPLTEEFQEQSETDGKTYTVQYFERNRFEYHPENSPPYDVLLGLLGRTVTKDRENEAAFKPTVARAGPGVLYFPETGHNIPAQFSDYWRRNGGLPVYGFPISEAFEEVSKTDGKTYLVQYFERNRFEYHPELPEQFRVSLGLLGVDVLRARGWIP